MPEAQKKEPMTHPSSKPFSPKKYILRLVWETAIVLGICIVAGIALNAVLPHGIPFVTPWCTKTTNSSESKAIQERLYCTELQTSTGLCYINTEDVKELMKKDALILDARTADFYHEGHLPGALLLDFYNMDMYWDEVRPKLDRYAIYVIYCNGGDCEDSQLLATQLINEGYYEPRVYKGGYEKWVELGNPIETSTPN
jgi:rhodanese-related sulfurtransferase